MRLASPTRARVAAATAILALAVPGAPVLAGEPADPSDADATIRILSVDISSHPAQEPAQQRDSEPDWRTSFGSERRTVARAGAARSAFDADLVLLQGIRDLRSLRRLFPARAWRLIVSRQLFSSEDPLDPWARDSVVRSPTTGIAVRYQVGLRVTGQDHLLDLAQKGDAGGIEPQPAGTAARIQFGKTTLWALSVLISPSCLAAEQSCAAWSRLADWQKERAGDGAKVLIGGRFSYPSARVAEPTPSLPGCRGLGLRLAEGRDTPEDGGVVQARNSVGHGCIAEMVIAK